MCFLVGTQKWARPPQTKRIASVANGVDVCEVRRKLEKDDRRKSSHVFSYPKREERKKTQEESKEKREGKDREGKDKRYYIYFEGIDMCSFLIQYFIDSPPVLSFQSLPSLPNTSSPSQLHVPFLFFESSEFSWCCWYVSGYRVTCRGTGQLPRARPQKKTDIPPPAPITANSSSARVGLCDALPHPPRNFDWLGLMQLLCMQPQPP